MTQCAGPDSPEPICSGIEPLRSFHGAEVHSRSQIPCLFVCLAQTPLLVLIPNRLLAFLLARRAFAHPGVLVLVLIGFTYANILSD